MPETLSLFEDSELQAKASRGVPRRPSRSAPDAHLEAARRIAKTIRKVPFRSDAQVRLSGLLCRHLIAMLNDDAEASKSRERL